MRDLTDSTGQLLQSGLTSWIVGTTGNLVEHLAAANQNSELIVFYRSPAYDWRTVNVTVEGRKTATRKDSSNVPRNRSASWPQPQPQS